MKPFAGSNDRNGKPFLLLNSFKESSNSGRERRSFSRQNFSAPLEISHFADRKRKDAELINHSEGGMCIRSRVKYNPSMSLFVRVKNFKSNDACIGDCNGLRSISLADVKWCQKVDDVELSYFKIGLQFCPPAY